MVFVPKKVCAVVTLAVKKRSSYDWHISEASKVLGQLAKGGKLKNGQKERTRES